MAYKFSFVYVSLLIENIFKLTLLVFFRYKIQLDYFFFPKKLERAYKIQT